MRIARTNPRPTVPLGLPAGKALLLAACAAVGFAARWSPAADPPPPPAARAASIAPPPAACGAELVAASLELAQVAVEVRGVPEPFPDVPEVQPREVANDLATFEEDCEDGTPVYVSCDEYPCVAVIRGSCVGAPSDLGWSWFSDHRSRDLILPDGTRAAFTIVARYEADETRALAAPIGDHQRNRARRLAARVDEAMDAVAADLGAHALSEWEHTAESVELALDTATRLEDQGVDPAIVAMIEDSAAIFEEYLEQLPEDP